MALPRLMRLLFRMAEQLFEQAPRCEQLIVGYFRCEVDHQHQPTTHNNDPCAVPRDRMNFCIATSPCFDEVCFFSSDVAHDSR
jgi:hypothetical protein